MKDAVIIIVIIVLIFGGDYLIKKHLQKTTNELVKDLENLKEKTVIAKDSENREEIKKSMNEVEKQWEKISKIWSTVIMHQEIDNIQQALVRAKTDIGEGNIEDAIPEIETAIFFAEHINEREQLKLKNIF